MAESRRDEIAKLEALYASNPDGRVFTHLAEAYRRAGELERAREILDRGLQRHPDYPSAHVVLGRVHADLGSDEEAATSFRRVLELDPENLIARRSLAEAARSAGRDEEALQHYRELLAQDPSASEVREIVDELDARLHGPPAPPPVMPSSWSATQDAESWDAPEPAAPQESAYGGFDQGTSVPDAPAAGDLDLSGTFGVEGLEQSDDSAETPAQPEPSPFDPEPLDLSGVDFGGSAAAPEETTADAAAEEPVTDNGYDASGWGEWPDGGQEPAEEAGSETLASPVGEPGPAPVAGESDAEPAVPETEADADLDTGPVHTDEPEPFAGRPTVEAPFEDEEVRAPEPTVEPVVEEAAAEFAPEPDELPAAESATPPASEPEPDWPGVPARAGSRDEFDAYGVPTETLAALYEAQGFADRAAAVYRALLRDRPDDERLRERARAADEAAAAQRAERSGIEETREVWVSGAVDSWDTAGQSRTAYAWDDAEEEDDGLAAGPSIGDYLQRVLSWRPTEAAAAPEADEPAASGDVQWEVESADAEAAAAEPVEAEEPAVPSETPDAESVEVEEPSAPWEAADAEPVEVEAPSAPWAAADTESVDVEEATAPWEAAEAESTDADAPVAPWDAPEPADDESPAPWDAGEEREDDHETLGGFVFGGEPGGTEESDAAVQPAASEGDAQRDDGGLDIEYGYGLAPGESAFGAHPPEEAAQVVPDDVDSTSPIDADEDFAAGEPLVFGEEPEADELPYLTPSGDTGLHLDTLLPLPPEDAVPDEPATSEEPATTWFEPEPVAADADSDDAPAGMPFDFAEPDEPLAEPLPFAFEDIGTEPESPAAEALPFDLAALGGDIDDEPGEPQPDPHHAPRRTRAAPRHCRTGRPADGPQPGTPLQFHPEPRGRDRSRDDRRVIQIG